MYFRLGALKVIQTALTAIQHAFTGTQRAFTGKELALAGIQRAHIAFTASLTVKLSTVLSLTFSVHAQAVQRAYTVSRCNMPLKALTIYILMV